MELPADDKRDMALENLDHFCCTEKYYRLTPLRNVLFTDGMKHVADEGGAYWLMALIAGHCIIPFKMGQHFLTAKLTKGETGTAEVVIDDGNGNVLVAQHIPMTDFPLKEFQCFAAGQGDDLVVMLPSEY